MCEYIYEFAMIARYIQTQDQLDRLQGCNKIDYLMLWNCDDIETLDALAVLHSITGRDGDGYSFSVSGCDAVRDITAIARAMGAGLTGGVTLHHSVNLGQFSGLDSMDFQFSAFSEIARTWIPSFTTQINPETSSHTTYHIGESGNDANIPSHFL
jgi:hypothetical protein